MKHLYSIWALLAVVSAMVLGCTGGKTLEVADFVHYDMWDTSASRDHNGCIDYDSVTFSDGSYAVKQLMFAPQNRLTRYVDRDGRLMATVSGASETYDQVLVYGHDRDGRLTHLLRFDEKLEPRFHDECTDSAYLHFRLAIDSIDFDRPDTTRHTLSRIVYGGDGHVLKVCEIPSGKVIQAPDGYRLEVNVDPCVGFWSDDLDGGIYLLKVDIVPKDKAVRTYSVKRFVDFIPTTEEYYRDGQCVRTVCHPNPNHPDDVRTVKERRVENGANVYVTCFDGSGDTLVSVWKGGLLREWMRKSKYGTVIEKECYSYPSPGKARCEEMRYDYRAKALKPSSTNMMELSDMPPEEEEMNPLSGYSWENVYEK